MSGRRFSTEEYAGVRVAFPTDFADRLVDVARAELAAQLRLVDDDADPALVLQRWLDGKQTVPMPGPHAEPGDLLVKVARAETWTFTARGWRELAPIEIVGDPVDAGGAGEPLWGERLADARRDRRAYDVAAGHPEPERDFLIAPPADVRAGWDHHDVPEDVREAVEFTGAGRRFFGKGVVEKQLDRLRAEKNADAAAADPVPPVVRDALDELHHHADVLEDIAHALGDHPDGGNNSPHYEAIAQARTFARAIEYSRGIIWKHATRRQGSS